MGANRLKREHKEFAVRCFARFMQATEVAAAIKEQFGIEISVQAAAYYNPTTAAGAGLAKSLKDLYDAERESYRGAELNIPTANRVTRLEILDRRIRHLLNQSRVNDPLVAQLLEQQAREMGGMFTNRRELTGKDGGPLAVDDARSAPEQKAARVLSLVTKGRARKAARAS